MIVGTPSVFPGLPQLGSKRSVHTLVIRGLQVKRWITTHKYPNRASLALLLPLLCFHIISIGVFYLSWLCGFHAYFIAIFFGNDSAKIGVLFHSHYFYEQNVILREDIFLHKPVKSYTLHN